MGQEVAGITSRRICCCVATHWLLRRDASEAASWRNFSSLRASGAAYADETMFFIAQVHTFHWVYGYDCAGWRIRLRWVTDTTSLGQRYDFVGWKRQFRWLNKALDVAEWSGWSSRMKYLNEAVDVAEFSTISWLNFSMRFKNGLKVQKLLAQGGHWKSLHF